MKPRHSFCSALVALLAVPLLLAGCDDDPSAPENEVYRAETVQVSGAMRGIPAVLYDGPVDFNDGTGEDVRLTVQRATLILGRDGRYEFSGDYRAELAETGTIPLGAFEDGSYTRSGNTIRFDAFSSSALFEDQFLSGTGTIANGVLTVEIIDPFFEDLENANLYTFRR